MTSIATRNNHFQLKWSEPITLIDYQIVFMLYQPIIGVNATNVYLTLINEKELTSRINLDFTFNRIKNLLTINDEDLSYALSILEQYQLITTFYHQTRDSYLYQLNKPLSANNFFANLSWKENLQNKIGNFDFERQKYYFQKNETIIDDGYVCVNKTENNSNNLSNIETNFITENDDKINKTIAWSKLKINDENENPLSNQNSFHHLFKPKTQAKSSLHANLMIENDNNSYYNYGQEQEITKKIALMENKDVKSYWSLLTNKELDLQASNTIKLLQKKYQLNSAVINCLVEYVWFKNNQRIEPNYILKIAATFNKKNINDIDGAMKHLKTAYSKSKKWGFSSSYHQDVLWTSGDNYESETTSENNSLMNYEQIAKIMKKIDNY